MHKSFLLHYKILQMAITLRELAPSTYFFLLRYVLLISMSLRFQEQDIKKKQSVMDGQTNFTKDNNSKSIGP